MICIKNKLKACTLLGYALFFMVLAGCKSTPQKIRSSSMVDEHTIPFSLPLISSDIYDISLAQDATVLEMQSLFSVHYLHRFFIYEMERLGWLCQINTHTINEEYYMIFEQKHRRVMITLLPCHVQQELSCIRIIGNPQSTEPLDASLSLLRYSPE